MLIEMATASDLGEHIIRTNPTPVIGSRKKQMRPGYRNGKSESHRPAHRRQHD
jgi:hypothetical protein